MWWRLREYGREIYKRASDRADVLIEKFPGAWRAAWKWGLSRKSVPVWMLVVTALSLVVGWLSMALVKQANHVSEASVAFNERSFRDQIQMGHPSISIMGGATLIAPRSSDPGFTIYGTETGPTYAVQVTLRNSGGRDAAPMWVAISEDIGKPNPYAGKRIIARLPKDAEETLTFDLAHRPSHGSWEVAYAYMDQVPLDQDTGQGAPSQLTVHCIAVSFVKLDSRPKDGDTDDAIRTLSPGSLFMMERMSQGPDGHPIIKTTAQGLWNDLHALMWQEPSCRYDLRAF
jgi:hypothetical protein